MKSSKHKTNKLNGAGIFDWLKNQYKKITTAPNPQPIQTTKQVIIEANQQLPTQIPSTNILHQIASNAYKQNPPQVAGYQLIQSNPTLKFYQSLSNQMLYVIGVRGTEFNDKNDRTADLSFNEGIVGNNLNKSARYKNDEKIVQEFLQKYNLINKGEFIIGAGHSLGGAINDELLRAGLIDYAVSFNPAVQPKDINNTQFHRRIYLDKDPLYMSMAKNNVKNNIEVRQTPQTTGSNLLGSINSNLGSIWQTKNAHSIDNFIGGRHYDEDKNMWVGSGCMCPRNYDPIEVNGKIYSNKCQANCAKQYDENTNSWVGGTQYFNFYDDNQVLNFAGELKTRQCSFLINDRRCKRMVVIGNEFCFQHLTAELKLKIKPSQHGKGAFAFISKKQNENNTAIDNQTLVFKKGDLIEKYHGETITQDELNKRYDSDTNQYTAPYAMEVSKRVIIDPALDRGVCSMINHSKQNNVKFMNPSNGQISIRATKNIYHNQELLANYGNNYELNDGATHTTGYRKDPQTYRRQLPYYAQD